MNYFLAIKMAGSKQQLSKQLLGHYSKALKNDACLETWHCSCLNNLVATVRAYDGLWKAPRDWYTQAEWIETDETVCWTQFSFLCWCIEHIIVNAGLAQSFFFFFFSPRGHFIIQKIVIEVAHMTHGPFQLFLSPTIAFSHINWI